MHAQQFKSARTSLEMTQAELARELGVTEATIGNYESGRSEVPRAIDLALKFLANGRRPKSLGEWRDEFTDIQVRARATFDAFREAMETSMSPPTRLRDVTANGLPSIESTLEAYNDWRRGVLEVEDFMARFRSATISQLFSPIKE